MERLIVIRTVNQAQELLKILEHEEAFAFDIETTGLSVRDKVIGFSISRNESEGFYVVLREYDQNTSSLFDTPIYNQAKEILGKLKHKKLIGHNILFDVKMIFIEFGIDLREEIYADTMLMAHLLDENRPVGLKELGHTLFGDSAVKEQEEMKKSIVNNGGSTTRKNYELYKADSELIARYGAKDTILTLKVFCELAPKLEEQGLDKFYYDEEVIPLLKTATYDMNTQGLAVDIKELQRLETELIASGEEDQKFIKDSIFNIVKNEYLGTNKRNTFNIDSPKQMAWLLFIKLGIPFESMTKEGRNLLRAVDLRPPVSRKYRDLIINFFNSNKGQIWEEARISVKTGKLGRPKRIGALHNYLAADKDILKEVAKRFNWLDRLLKYKKDQKILNTYVRSMLELQVDGVVYGSFLQHGTTSGRFSSKNPNLQNLPRDDKRVKKCIISKPGKSFVGADQSQLEIRVFASLAGDKKLIDGFKTGDDFYSIVASEVFGIYGVSLVKDAPDSLSVKYKEFRQMAKVVALSIAYGTTAPKLAKTIKKTREEAQEIIDAYLEKFSGVHSFMLETHKKVKSHGIIYTKSGRPRRLPKAVHIAKLYGDTPHKDLPYDIRKMLNLSVNHQIQGLAASVMNRSAIRFYELLKINNIKDCHIVLQVHDSLVAECNDSDIEIVKKLLQESMEITYKLDGVDFEAKPVIAKKYSEL